MKKFISFILVLAVIGAGCAVGYVVYDNATNPEKLIVGKWVNAELDNLYYVFNEDGTVSGNIEILGQAISLNGTYTIDKENSKITMTNDAVFGLSANIVRNFKIEDDKLTLTDDTTNLVSVFSRATDAQAGDE